MISCRISVNDQCVGLVCRINIGSMCRIIVNDQCVGSVCRFSVKDQ